MARTIYLDKLLRLTLTRKGKAIAKHPLLREGAVEAIKAEQSSAKAEAVDDGPLWTACKAGPPDADDEDDDWYTQFAAHIITIPGEDIPASWEESFAEAQEASDHSAYGRPKPSQIETEKAKGHKNYPDGSGPFAGPHNSFPISSQAHVYAAARLIGHAANPAAVKQRIIAIAHARGYQLPKSWAKKAQGSEEPGSSKSWQKATKGAMDIEEILAKVSEAIKAALGQAPAEPEAPAQPTEQVEAEKAASASHSHMHPHSTMRGYGYEHDHAHPNTDPSSHDTSESAHAHTHTAKAEDLDPAVAADLAGLDAKVAELEAALAATRTEKDALTVALQAKDAELTEKAKVAEDASKAAETATAELKAAEEAAKAPLTVAPPQTTEKAASKPISEMSFDDAFTALLHG